MEFAEIIDIRAIIFDDEIILTEGHELYKQAYEALCDVHEDEVREEFEGRHHPAGGY